VSKRSTGEKKNRRPKQHRSDCPPDSLTPLDPNVAGIDIGSTTHFVAAPNGSAGVAVKTFGCLTPDLIEMSDWLKECNVSSVVMEATGVYWIPVYQTLEDRGLKVQLVDARHSRNVPGRKKTDNYDCNWLRKLQSYGLLKACFVPPKDVAEMREYWRRRTMLVHEASRQIQMVQKSMEQMNLQLHKVISDMSGVTGMSIIRAIVSGERNPETLARLRQPGVKSSEEIIVKALTGNWREEHLFGLKQAIDAYDFAHRQIQECDVQLEECLKNFQPRQPPAPEPSITEGAEQGQTGEQEPRQDKSLTCSASACNASDNSTVSVAGLSPKRRLQEKNQKRSKNHPAFNLRDYLISITGVDLTIIDGIDVMTAQTIITECGPDLSAFETEGNFASWLGLCPNNKITGGRIISSATRKVKNRAGQAFRIAAQSLWHSKTALGAYFRRMAGRRGSPVAITATAHKLARLVFRAIKYGQEYVDRGQEWYEQQYRSRVHERVLKEAAQLGYRLVLANTGQVVS
jgi:transposase